MSVKQYSLIVYTATKAPVAHASFANCTAAFIATRRASTHCNAN